MIYLHKIKKKKREIIMEQQLINQLKSKVQNSKVDVYMDNELQIETNVHRRIEAMIEAMFSEGEEIFLEDKVLVKDISNIENLNDFIDVYVKWFSDESLKVKDD